MATREDKQPWDRRQRKLNRRYGKAMKVVGRSVFLIQQMLLQKKEKVK